jgi:hypothetical protein
VAEDRLVMLYNRILLKADATVKQIANGSIIRTSEKLNNVAMKEQTAITTTAILSTAATLTINITVGTMINVYVSRVIGQWGPTWK